jgi:hypothetical protein
VRAKNKTSEGLAPMALVALCALLMAAVGRLMRRG